MIDFAFQVHDSKDWTQLKNVLNYIRANFELIKNELGSFDYKILMKKENIEECYMIVDKKSHPPDRGGNGESQRRKLRGVKQHQSARQLRLVIGSQSRRLRLSPDAGSCVGCSGPLDRRDAMRACRQQLSAWRESAFTEALPSRGRNLRKFLHAPVRLCPMCAT
ncbi:hypothetical protein FHG87_016843 [Trinorchestia longiramus]|nr:hypothetical protein FHG87_016843 [Trinorchestia longiramus]